MEEVLHGKYFHLWYPWTPKGKTLLSWRLISWPVETLFSKRFWKHIKCFPPKLCLKNLKHLFSLVTSHFGFLYCCPDLVELNALKESSVFIVEFAFCINMRWAYFYIWTILHSYKRLTKTLKQRCLWKYCYILND